MAYQTLGADAYCSPFPKVAKGKTYNTTIAYDQDDLSTTQGEFFHPQFEKGSGTAINFSEWQSSLPKYSPMFSLPAELSALDPAWNTCLPRIYGALDPPRALAKATALVSLDAATPAYSTAVPGAGVGPANTPATVTPAPINPENEYPSDSSGGDLGGPSANNQNVDQATSKSQKDPTGTPENSQNFDPANSKGRGDPAGASDNSQIVDPAKTPPGSTPTVNNDPSLRLSQEIPMQTVSGGSIIINGATLGPGHRMIHDGASPSAGNDRTMIDGTLYHLPTSQLSAPLIIDDQSIARASDGGIILGSSTIPLGSSATIASHTITPFPSFVILDGVRHALPTSAGAILFQPSNPQPSITAITLANGAVITQGGPPAIVSHTTYFIPLSATALFVNGNPVTLANALLTSVFAVAGQMFTANPTAFAIGGQSLSVGGPAVTVSGTVVSLGPAGLRIGSSTVALDAAQGSGDVRLGDVSMAGPGSGASAARGNQSTRAEPVAFTGVARRMEVGGRSLALLVILEVCICVAMVRI